MLFICAGYTSHFYVQFNNFIKSFVIVSMNQDTEEMITSVSAKNIHLRR